MKLNLKQVFDIPGESREFSYELPLSDYELYGTHPFCTPVTLQGKATNEAGIIYLRYTAVFTLCLPCDRCLDDFKREYSYHFEEILVPQESPEHDEYIAVPDAVLDLDELCLSDILLSLPSKQLCREDCKGLCPVCGQNRNLEDCEHIAD